MNSLKSRAMNCGPLSELTRGFASRYFLPRSLQNDFGFFFGHRFPQIPMDDRTAIAIQNAAQVVEAPITLMWEKSMCQCWCGCSKPVALYDGLPLHRDSTPACWSTRQPLEGLTATTSLQLQDG